MIIFYSNFIVRDLQNRMQMTTFNLANKTIKRLQTMSKRFRKIRALVHENIISYINDYRNFHGNINERNDELRRKYLSRNNALILHDDDSKILFHVNDIAIITGYDDSAITRMLAKIERSDKFCAGLLAIRHETKSANNNLIYAYETKIFDLILDYREIIYLERFRRAGSSDFNEIIKYWEYLKNLQDNANIMTIIESNQEIQDSPVPLMSLHNIIKLIGSKLFTIKTDMIFAIIFALTFALAKNWPNLIPIFVIISLTILLSCALMLRLRTPRTGLISDTGAIAALLVIFWGVNLTLDNGIYTPGGTVLNLKGQQITLNAIRGREMHLADTPLAFQVIPEKEGEINEIFYSINKSEYKSTGFYESGYPKFFVNIYQDSGEINLNIKYLDNNNKEHGDFAFKFDYEQEYFNAGKNLLLNREDSWLIINDFLGTTSVEAYTNDTVKSIVYGINTHEPEEIFNLDNHNNNYSQIFSTRNNNIKFISSYLIFTDGTSSDIRITNNYFYNEPEQKQENFSITAAKY